MKYAILLFTFLAQLSAQPLSYALLPSGDEAPSPRVDGAVAYDPAGKRIFMFGGQDNTGFKNDLWSYSLTDQRWAKLSPSGGIPAPRHGHIFVFDSMRRRVILYGGQGAGFFSDVWALDIATMAWRLIGADTGTPARRYGHSGIYEPGRDRIVISHGFASGRFDDTWAFSLANNTWTNLSPASGRPLRRCLHHAVYDQANGEMLLYGGCSSGSGPCPQADLWAFNLLTNTWQERTPRPSPAGREHYGVAFDAARGKMVVFGGSGGGLLADTWEYDAKGRFWQTATIEGPVPTARKRHQGVFAPDIAATFFFGGGTNTANSNELWMLAQPKPRVVPMINSVSNIFSGEGGSISPGEAVSIAGVNLDPQTSVTVNGVAAGLYLASPTEIRMQVPYDVTGFTEASIIVAAGGEFSTAMKIPVAETHPGISATIYNQDESANSEEKPAAKGSLITIFATGLGVVNPDVPTEPAARLVLTFGAREVEITAKSLAADLPGVFRIVARVPEDLEDSAPVEVRLSTAEGVRSQADVMLQIAR